MIFVTVGTNPLGHDDLIETVDKIQSSLSEQIVMQIGYGRYEPAHGEFFRLAPSLQPFLSAPRNNFLKTPKKDFPIK